VLTYVFSGLALITGLTSLGLSILTYRMAGPRLTLVGQSFSFLANEVWLQIKIANAGKGEVDIDGATCDLLGPTVSTLPHRMKAASSHLIEFRAPLVAGLGRSGSVTVNVGLGNGRSLTSQVRMTEAEQADLRRRYSALQTHGRQSLPPTASWQPPSQEEL
jgi:hypothetical protein